MAKRKGTFGINTYTKRSTKKRPGRHSKSPNKNTKEFKKKRYRGQGNR